MEFGGYLKQIGHSLTNAQDKALVGLIYSGILGQDYSQIINLQVADIDFSNHMARVANPDGDVLTFQIDEDTISAIERAVDQKEYLIEGNEGRTFLALKETTSVIRPTESEVEITKEVIDARLARIGEAWSIDDFSAYGIFNCGMFDRGI